MADTASHGSSMLFALQHCKSIVEVLLLHHDPRSPGF